MVSGGGQSSEQTSELDNCKTGADANKDDNCRMAAATDSLDVYWNSQFDSGYRKPGVVLYTGAVSYTHRDGYKRQDLAPHADSRASELFSAHANFALSARKGLG